MQIVATALQKPASWHHVRGLRSNQEHCEGGGEGYNVLLTKLLAQLLRSSKGGQDM